MPVRDFFGTFFLEKSTENVVLKIELEYCRFLGKLGMTSAHMKNPTNKFMGFFILPINRIP